MSGSPLVVSAAQARHLLMERQGLLWDPARRCGPRTLQKAIEKMGFVQLDTINVFLRAHHQILLTRFEGYRSTHLRRLLQKDRALFEHWTHDASVIPTTWLRPWMTRFAKYPERVKRYAWWRERMGPNANRMINRVYKRVEQEGPLRSRDFEHDRAGAPGAWWNWKPQKAALEYLWRCGRLGVTRRENFHKVYDVMARVHPSVDDMKRLSKREHDAWAGSSAMERLGCATAAEIAGFVNAISLVDARAWCKIALKRGEIVPVVVESADGSAPTPRYALPDIEHSIRKLPDVDDKQVRLLSPFDPVVRDRKRALRLFSFDYRFEAFVPAAKRIYGYYTLPILRGDRFIGRVDAKLDRKKDEIIVNGLWWEPGVRATKRLRSAVDENLERMAAFK